jgi:hypothetical protein
MSVPYVAPAGLPLARDAGRPAEVSPYRRPTSPARRRRRTALRLVGKALLAAVIVATPVAAGWWLLRQPRLALSELHVAGNTRVDRTFIEQSLAPWRGQNLLFVPLADAQAALARHPWVAGVEVAKELPNRLRVRIVERQPAALLQRGGALYYLDAQGETIAPFQSLAAGSGPGASTGTGSGAVHGETNLLVIHDPTGNAASRRAAMAVAAELARLDAGWAAALTQIDVLGDGDYRLTSHALSFPLLVRSGQMEAKGRRLRALLPELSRRYAAIQSVDLRFPRRIVVRPLEVPNPPAEPPGAGAAAVEEAPATTAATPDPTAARPANLATTTPGAGPASRFSSDSQHLPFLAERVIRHAEN